MDLHRSPDAAALAELDAQQKVEKTVDPMVEKLKPMDDEFFKLHFCDSNCRFVTYEEAQKAISELPKKKNRFVLPGRARVTSSMAEILSAAGVNEYDCGKLDYDVGTRINLLSKLEKALQQKNYVASPSDSTVPDMRPADFPTMFEHSQHWRLNKKQHQAFVLIAAALLKHVACENESEESSGVRQGGVRNSNKNRNYSNLLVN